MQVRADLVDRQLFGVRSVRARLDTNALHKLVSRRRLRGCVRSEADGVLDLNRQRCFRERLDGFAERFLTAVLVALFCNFIGRANERVDAIISEVPGLVDHVQKVCHRGTQTVDSLSVCAHNAVRVIQNMRRIDCTLRSIVFIVVMESVIDSRSRKHMCHVEFYEIGNHV